MDEGVALGREGVHESMKALHGLGGSQRQCAEIMGAWVHGVRADDPLESQRFVNAWRELSAFHARKREARE